MADSRLVLGIETSCDETAAAVYAADRGILSNSLFSQIAVHERYGGVMPELAAQGHLEKINSIVAHALNTAHVSLQDIDVVAVTNKPGLPGSLLIGVCFAKAIAWSINKKLIGIDHLEGHIFSANIEHAIPFPYLCLTASGGHTALYIVHDFGNFSLIGHTMDDAAGEAFDKIAKLLHLPYPGGPVIEKLARNANFEDFFHYPRGKKDTLDFSFSGLKTAVLYDMVKRNAYNLQEKKLLDDSPAFKEMVASSLLVCVADIFEQKLMRALHEYSAIKAISFVGGVACNAYIKNRLRTMCEQRGVSFFTPSPQYCTDNGAMIAFVGNYKAAQGKFSGWDLDIFE